MSVDVQERHLEAVQKKLEETTLAMERARMSHEDTPAEIKVSTHARFADRFAPCLNRDEHRGGALEEYMRFAVQPAAEMLRSARDEIQTAISTSVPRNWRIVKLRAKLRNAAEAMQDSAAVLGDYDEESESVAHYSLKDLERKLDETTLEMERARMSTEDLRGASITASPSDRVATRRGYSNRRRIELEDYISHRVHPYVAILRRTREEIGQALAKSSCESELQSQLNLAIVRMHDTTTVLHADCSAR